MLASQAWATTPSSPFYFFLLVYMASFSQMLGKNSLRQVGAGSRAGVRVHLHREGRVARWLALRARVEGIAGRVVYVVSCVVCPRALSPFHAVWNPSLWGGATRLWLAFLPSVTAL